MALPQFQNTIFWEFAKILLRDTIVWDVKQSWCSKLRAKCQKKETYRERSGKLSHFFEQMPIFQELFCFLSISLITS